MLRGLVLAFVFVMTALLAPRAARADQPGAHTVPVAVLVFDSEDADAHADAITGALRSRVRSAPGWSLSETSQALGMLTAALKCTSRPSVECQQRIADHVKAERFIWGVVTKGPEKGQVTVEVHLYQRGKPDTVVKESYADNLKDGNDDSLRAVASRIIEQLGGSALGVVVVRAPATMNGEVVVDGGKHVPLQRGAARIELAAGGHSVELVPAGECRKRNVLVTAGRESVVEFTPQKDEETPFPTRKVVGGVAMGVGAVLGAIAVVELVRYANLQSDGDAYARSIPPPRIPGTPCKDDQNERCRQLDADSKTASGVAIGTGIAGALAIGLGAFVFFSAPSETTKPQRAAAPGRERDLDFRGDRPE